MLFLENCCLKSNIIIEVQKTKIRNIKQLNDIVEKNINGGETTLLIVIYDNNNL